MNEGVNFGYVIGLLIFGVFFGVLGALVPVASTVFFGFSVLCIVGVLAILIIKLVESRGTYFWMLGQAAQKIASLPDERFQMLGLVYPKIRVRWPAGRAEVYFDDTNATMEHFKIFMAGSDSEQIYPERNCNAELPRLIWNEIRICLEDYGHIVTNSHAGPHSWLWITPQTYANLRAFFGVWIDPRIREVE